MPWVAVDRWEEPEWSLGWQVADWMEVYLRVPGGAQFGEPLVLSGWQLRSLVDWYAVGVDGQFLFRRGQVRLSKGTGKSPWAAGIVAAELCGPVVFDGFDASGEPVGRPRAAPWLQVGAVSEDQAGNTYGAFYAMLQESPLLDEEGVDLGLTRTILRGRPGRVEVVTASAGSREGQPITFAVADETHLWGRSNGGRRLYATIRRNATKMGARILSTTNAWEPGSESVAEQTEAAALSMPGLLVVGPQYEAQVADLGDDGELRAGLELAYRDAPWVDVGRVFADCRDPDVTAEDVHRFFLNRPMAADAVLCADPTLSADGLEEGAPLAVGFDGSKTRDATALVGVHMESGVAWLLGYWERPYGLPRGERWEVPRVEVSSVVEEVFARFTVARFKADPSHWADELAGWQARWGRDVVDRFPVDRAGVVDVAVEAAQDGLRQGELRLSSGAASEVLVAQVQRANVRRQQRGSRLLRGLVKPEDGGRIDAAAALVYGVMARLEAKSRGWERPVEAPKRRAVAIWV